MMLKRRQNQQKHFPRNIIIYASVNIPVRLFVQLRVHPHRSEINSERFRCFFINKVLLTKCFARQIFKNLP